LRSTSAGATSRGAYLENELARQFYADMCRLEHWSVRTLRDRVRSMMFERTATSRLPDETIRQDLEQLRDADTLTPELIFRDPYLLDFLGLKDAYSERDLEAAILRSSFLALQRIRPMGPNSSSIRIARRQPTAVEMAASVECVATAIADEIRNITDGGVAW
jgi:hypothetical protein